MKLPRPPNQPPVNVMKLNYPHNVNLFVPLLTILDNLQQKCQEITAHQLHYTRRSENIRAHQRVYITSQKHTHPPDTASNASPPPLYQTIIIEEILAQEINGTKKKNQRKTNFGYFNRLWR